MNLSPDTKENYDIVLKSIQENLNSMLVAGEKLLWLKETGKYRGIGGNMTWINFIQEHLHLRYTTANRYVQIAKKFIKECGMTPVELNKYDTWSLSFIASRVNKENLQEWLDKLEKFSRTELVKEVKEKSKI